KAAEECSRLTHTHPDGYNGAILQCLAVNTALGLDPTKNLDPVHFICSLENKMENIELKGDKKTYSESLKKIKDIYLKKQEDISAEEIAEYLGNAVSAQRSVPTAIYSFLRGLSPFLEYESSNPFVRTLFFAISVGGDTDTIASMAGSIAGAYHGADSIPQKMKKRCELIDEVTELADKIFDKTEKDNS
ncbi:ADP-ribose glycohydrolase ARH3-like, partial [Stegodyphus dumicola]|uniref:ADP-ribose glycohydrolase ARH3-like n=1 Tax=Stegodyphus dumicola TaxID=202533 RepID=UPI0015A89C50